MQIGLFHLKIRLPKIKKRGTVGASVQVSQLSFFIILDGKIRLSPKNQG